VRVADAKGKFPGNHKLSTRVKADWCIAVSSTFQKWGIKMRFNTCLAALAVTFVAATPAVAQQASATANARGVVLSPLTLTKVSDLDFGTVAASAAAGNVTVDADSGFRTVSGGVTAVPSTPTRGEFTGLAQAATTVQLTLVPPTGNVLVSGTNSVTVNSMSFDSAGTTRVVPAGGSFTVGVGGDFGIAANQPNGTYTALFQVTADYQ
jgi:hypothetical protein